MSSRVERYSRYYRMSVSAGEPEPNRCDAIVSDRQKASISGWSHRQCMHKSVKDGLCKRHSRMTESQRPEPRP